MQPVDLKQIAHAWFKAFNTKDIELLLSLYDAEASHYSPKLKIRQPETNGLIKGQAALKAWWADAFERMPQLKYEIIHLMREGEQVFMEYTRICPGEEDMRIGEVLLFKADKIIFSRVYHS